MIYRITSCFCMFLVGAMFLFAEGCASKAMPQNPETTRSIQITQLSKQLEASGAQVTRTGERIRVVFLSDQLFNPHSANLISSHPAMLDALVRLMKDQETTSVQISAYTNVMRAQFQNKALSAAQAQTVADYVWAKGVDARLFYSVGYGVDKAYTGLFGNYSERLQRRVEVEFQYLPLLSSVAY